MKYILLLLIPFVFSCKPEKPELIRLSYSDNLLQQNNVSINLPTINNGEYFFEEDSVLYCNVFVLDDSTIKFNDSIYKLPKGERGSVYMARNFEGNNNNSFNVKSVVEIIGEDIKSKLKVNTTVTFNLYIDTSTHYAVLGVLYHNLFELSLDNVNQINLFGKENRFVAVNYSKGLDLRKMPVCGMMRYRNIFKILLNKSNHIMIEDNWDVDYKDIKPLIMEYYTNPNNAEELPEMVNVNKETCLQQIAILSAVIKEGDSTKVEKLNEWKAKLEAVKVLGAFKMLPKSTSIIVQADENNSYNTYFSIIDSISGGVMELRNNYCIDKFGKKYEELNHNFLLERIMKKAIDMVYPNKINSLVYYGVPKPPPPPPLVPSSSW
jgi:hypothetical protein